MPGVAHELPPVHRGVVDAVVLVSVGGALVVQGGGALLTLPGNKHPRGEKGCGRERKRRRRKIRRREEGFSKAAAAAALHASLPASFFFRLWQTHSTSAAGTQ